MKNYISSLLMLVTILALVACGSGANGQSAVREATQAQAAAGKESLKVVMNDIYYGDSNDNVTNPPIWTVSSGSEVSVTMDNKGVLEHNWAIVKSGEDVPEVYNETTDQAKLLFDAGVLSGAETQTVNFTAPTPGEYDVICTVPGHSQVMQGQLVVN